MWRVLLDMLAAARRPLVVLDFETAGLGGKPPVEFAALVFAPWETPVDDADTLAARGACPPGLTYACTMRLDPLCPIEPGAQRVHGISDDDVRGKARAYNDFEVAGFFRGYAEGDAAEGVGRAVWAGHNVHDADLAWSRAWGYTPKDEAPDAIDTLRLHRRLSKEQPYPLAVDLLNGETDWCPAVGHGLDCYAGSLAGLHLALYGARPAGAHGALADACASARCLARLLDLWAPLWPGKVATQAPADALAALLAALNTPPPGQLAWSGWLDDEGDGLRWRRGKYRGQPVHRDAWVLGLSRLPTGRDGEGYVDPVEAAVIEKARAVAVAR